MNTKGKGVIYKMLHNYRKTPYTTITGKVKHKYRSGI